MSEDKGQPTSPRLRWPRKSEVRGVLGAFLVLLTLLLAAPINAAPVIERDPAEAEKLYHEIGSSMICLCGCRERLLDCSMVNCGFKEKGQRFLREECRDANKTPDQIRAAMIERFGPEIMQVHGDSLLYPVLFGGAFVTLALFGTALWFFATRGKTESPAVEAAGKPPSDPSLEARILREMEEIE